MSDAATPESIVPLSIVAIDDDPDFREYLSALLEADGHDLRAVASPEALWATCSERLPDVVLLDMKMGAHDGAEVLEDLRVRWPKLCVVVVTGYPTMDSMRETFKRDAFDYLAKPFGAGDLQRVLAQAAEALDLGRTAQDRLRAQLGRRIRLARTERGWTLKELSERSGISVSQLSSIERGAHLPSLESLLLVGEALESRPSAWLADTGF